MNNTNKSSLNSAQMPFDCDDNSTVVVISSLQYDAVHSVLNIVKSLQDKNTMLKNRVSNLWMIIGIYGLVLNDEVFSKLKENGFVVEDDSDDFQAAALDDEEFFE